jgi:TonB family protein
MKKIVVILILVPCTCVWGSAFDPSNFFYRTSPAGAPLRMEPVWYAPRPTYPSEAQQDSWGGEGLFELHVDTSGRVQFVKVSKSTGHSILDRAATEALRAWRFHPNSINVVRVPLQYSMKPLEPRHRRTHGYGLKARGDCEKGLIVGHVAR